MQAGAVCIVAGVEVYPVMPRSFRAASLLKDLIRKLAGVQKAQCGACFTAGGFQANPEDPRFSALYTSDKFGLDPTDPQYSETKFTAEIQARRAAQRLKPAATVAGGKKRQDETACVEDAAASDSGGTSLQSGGFPHAPAHAPVFRE